MKIYWKRRWEKGRDFDHVIGVCGDIVILALEDADTPVIVIHKYDDISASFDCARWEGEIEEYQLTEDELNYVSICEGDANEWFDSQRPEGWDG